MPENPRIFLARMVDLWNTGDPGAAHDLYSEFVVYHHPNRPEPFHGRDAILQQIAGIRAAFPDFELKINELIIEGNRFVAHWLWTGTHRGVFHGIEPTGNRVSARGVSVMRIESGRIIEEYMYDDALGLLRQLGVAVEAFRSQAHLAG